MIAAPPRAVDEEDELFFQSMHEAKQKRKELQEEAESKELARFRNAMVNHKKVDSSGLISQFNIGQKEHTMKQGPSVGKCWPENMFCYLIIVIESSKQ